MTAALPVLCPMPERAFPPLRLLPIPECEPPYDDEAAPPELRLVAGRPARRPAPAALPSAPAVPAEARDEDGVRRTPSSELPAPGLFARALVQRLLEVEAGARPVAQLQRDTSLELYERLERTVGRRGRAALRPPTAAVGRVHVQQRPEGVAEVCGTARRGERVVAFALRLEGLRGRWTCMELVGL